MDSDAALHWHGEATALLEYLGIARGYSAITPQWAESLMREAELRIESNSGTEAVRAAHAALKLWRNLSETRSAEARAPQARAQRLLGEALVGAECYDLALTSLGEVRQTYESAPSTAADRSRIERAEGLALAHLGQYDESVKRCQTALDRLAEGGDEPRLQGQLWSQLGSILTAMGRNDDALAAFDKSAEVFAHVDGPQGAVPLALARRDQGTVLLKVGQGDAAIAKYTEAERLLRPYEGHPVVDQTLAHVTAARTYATDTTVTDDPPRGESETSSHQPSA
jgi:tetratricopeptide (TPR) repeat protein